MPFLAGVLPWLPTHEISAICDSREFLIALNSPINSEMSGITFAAGGV